MSPAPQAPAAQRPLAARFDQLLQGLFEAFNRIRLPGPSVLPAAGAVVGLYSGLAAGLFVNLIALVSGLVFGASRLASGIQREPFSTAVWNAFKEANWHGEYVLVGAPIALTALWVARVIQPGGPREEVKRRLRILALLTLGALAMYYPLVALTALNTVIGQPRDMADALAHLPWWLKLLAPMLGGLAVGALLRNRPETHGHGVPEVVVAVKRAREGLAAQGGLLKLFASSITIGSGGSAGREGPIVFGGAAFASAVAQTLGFSRKELSILMACGAGAGIAASFNAPIAGAMFAMEIILREFELKVFSPIILASVTATMVARGVMGSAPMIIRHVGYTMVSGWEIVAYVGLGLVCGIVAYAFVRMLHHSEGFFGGKFKNVVSKKLGTLPLPVRAGIGGLLVGGMALLNPTVWGSGHEYVNKGAVGQLGFWFLFFACVLKLLATALTIGSGGSGGTFFPAAVIGAMAGGAFGALVHHFAPSMTAPSGAYLMVGMGGGVAGLTRGPLTGMMMLYELTGNYAIILPLMVTCTIASALAHALIERRSPKVLSDADLLAQTTVRQLALGVKPVPGDTKLRPLVDQLLTAEDGTLCVATADGKPYGIVQAEMLRDVWRDESLHPLFVAIDLARKVPPISADADLTTALARMDHDEVDALPVSDATKASAPFGLLTRAGIRRFLFSAHATAHQRAEVPVAPTELTH